MYKKNNLVGAFFLSFFAISGCVDLNNEYKNNESPPATDTPPDDPIISSPIAVSGSLNLLPPKVFSFTWSDVPEADYYRLLENPDGVSGYTQVGSNILPGAEEISITVPLFKRANSEYIIESCNSAGCTPSSALYPTETL